MPFDFLGTFNRSQFDRLSKYVKRQLGYVEGRILHLTAEQQRVGYLKFTFDSAGRPTGYTTGGPGFITYIGKLMAAYEVLGGDPFCDLQVRTMEQSVYQLRGDEVSSSKMMSNGEPIPQVGLVDAESGNVVREIKSYIGDSLNHLEKIERKVRRAVDYADQLQTEIKSLQGAQQSLTTSIEKINQLLSDPSNYAVINDNNDLHNKLGRAPIASYVGVEKNGAVERESGNTEVVRS